MTKKKNKAKIVDSTDDPIFAPIEACRVARLKSDAAYARVRRLLGIARYRFGSGDNQRKMRNSFVEQILGCNEDKYTDGPANALWDAYESFAQTVPTTLDGLFAMLKFAKKTVKREREAFSNVEVEIFSTLAAAARALGEQHSV